jgi:peptidylprolyl isomerase
LRARAIALLATAAIGLGACGDEETDLPAAVPATPTETTPAETTTSADTGGTPAAGGKKSGISTDLSSKPEIPKQSGKEPTKLVTKDIVVGKGAAAKAGDNVVVHYVGVLFKDGEQFDASWDSGQPFPFVLGTGAVIQGWDQGVAGMKVGGRRLLTIPPDLAYGASGQGSIGPNATLVFAVDLLNVTPG